MIRTFKALGLALVAIFAMSALVASAAQAQGVLTNTEATELTLTQDDEGGTNTATGLQTFATTSGSFTCDEFHAEATGLSSNSSLTEITFQNIKTNNVGKSTCTGPFSTSPTFEFNGCDYLFTIGVTIGTTGMETTGAIHLVCPVGKQITTTAPFCQTHFPAQSVGGHLVFKTITGAPDDITIEATLTGIQYQGTELCSSGSDGQYKGNFTVKGYKSAPHNAEQLTAVEVH